MAEIDGETDRQAGRSRRVAVWAIAGAAVLLTGGVAFAVSTSHHHSRDVASPSTSSTQSSAVTTALAPQTTTRPSTTKAVKPRTKPAAKRHQHPKQPTSTAPHTTVAASHPTTPPVVSPGTAPRATTPPPTAPPTTRPHPVTTTTISPTSPFAKITGPSPACIGASSYSYEAVAVRNGAYGYWTYLNAGVPVIKTWHAGQGLAVAFHGPAGTRLSIDLSLSNPAGVTRDFHKQVTMINC